MCRVGLTADDSKPTVGAGGTACSCSLVHLKTWFPWRSSLDGEGRTDPQAVQVAVFVPVLVCMATSSERPVQQSAHRPLRNKDGDARTRVREHNSGLHGEITFHKCIAQLQLQ